MAEVSTETLRERLDGLLSDQRRIGAVIAQNSKLSADEVAALFLEAKTKAAVWAVDKGIVHEIRDLDGKNTTRDYAAEIDALRARVEALEARLAVQGHAHTWYFDPITHCVVCAYGKWRYA